MYIYIYIYSKRTSYAKATLINSAISGKISCNLCVLAIKQPFQKGTEQVVVGETKHPLDRVKASFSSAEKRMSYNFVALSQNYTVNYN